MEVTPAPVRVPTQQPLVPSFSSVVGKVGNFSNHPRTCRNVVFKDWLLSSTRINHIELNWGSECGCSIGNEWAVHIQCYNKYSTHTKVTGSKATSQKQEGIVVPTSPIWFTSLVKEFNFNSLITLRQKNSRINCNIKRSIRKHHYFWTSCFMHWWEDFS